MTLSADGRPYRREYNQFIHTGEDEPWKSSEIPIRYADDGGILPPDNRDWQLVSVNIEEGMAAFRIAKNIYDAQA